MRPIDRLKKFVLDLKISESAFEKGVPLSNGYINKLEKGTTGSIGSEILYKISKKHPDLSLDWIITGRGGMQRLEAANLGVLAEPKGIYLPAPDNSITLPILDFQLAAGHGIITQYPEGTETITLPKSLINYKKGRTYNCGRIRGESMYPTMVDGGFVVISEVEKGKWSELRNDVYAIVEQDGPDAIAKLKRINNRFEKGYVMLHSDNPDKAIYPDYHLDAKNIISILQIDLYSTKIIPDQQSQLDARIKRLEDSFQDLRHELRPLLRSK